MSPARVSSWEAHIKLRTNDLVEVRKEWNIIRDGRRKLQKQLAERLIQAASVRIPRVGCGFYDIK